MIVRVVDMGDGESLYHGLRMSAEQYMNLEEDGCRYELIHGVVCLSPSPTAIHQEIVSMINGLLFQFLEANRLGKVYVEVDIPVAMAHDPDSSVYRPDVVFVRAEAAKSIGNKITEPPALVVEFVSPSTRSLDCVIKKQDYEKAAIEEYWMIDPGKDEMTFFGLREGVYMELPNDGQRFNSHTIEGFSLDLARIRQGWQQ